MKFPVSANTKIKSCTLGQEHPSRWMMVGIAMAIQENGTDSLDYFAMLRGWEMCRNDALV